MIPQTSTVSTEDWPEAIKNMDVTIGVESYTLPTTEQPFVRDNVLQLPDESLDEILIYNGPVLLDDEET